MIQKGFWSAGCQGGRDSPGGGIRHQEGDVPETPAVVEVVVETPSPLAAQQ